MCVCGGGGGGRRIMRRGEGQKNSEKEGRGE